ncbi:MAG: amidase family protein, partial [Planctomycetales bacterium]
PKHLDTVGPMAADIPHLVQGMDLLQRGFASRYRAAMADKPSARLIRIGRLYLSGTNPAIDRAIDEALVARGFKVFKLDDGFKEKWAQAESDGKTIALGDAWFNDRQYTHHAGIGATTRMVLAKGELDYATGYQAAVKRKAAWQSDLRRVFGKVDFIATPTIQSLPPRFPWFGSSGVFEWLVFDSQNTVGVNFAGNPALAIPILLPSNGKTSPVTSLQLVGPRLSEAELCNAGRLLAAKP